MNLLTNRCSIALIVLSPFFVCASEQSVYEIGDCMNISDFKTSDRLRRALELDNELAERCLSEDKREKKAIHAVAMQGLPGERKQLKKNFAYYAQKLDEDFHREEIDQEIARIEECTQKKEREALMRKGLPLLSPRELLLAATRAEALAEKRVIDAENECQIEHASKAFEFQLQKNSLSIDQKSRLKIFHNPTRFSPVVSSISRDTRTAKIVTYHLPPMPQPYSP